MPATASPEALEHLAALGGTGLLEAGEIAVDTQVRRESRALLFGFAEYHLDRRMKSLADPRPGAWRREHVPATTSNATGCRAHVGIVMDGNGRWAKQRGLPRTEGHAAGEAAMWDTVVGANELGLDWLTMFAFSTENWNRPKAEVRYLMASTAACCGVAARSSTG